MVLDGGREFLLININLVLSRQKSAANRHKNVAAWLLSARTNNSNSKNRRYFLLSCGPSRRVACALLL